MAYPHHAKSPYRTTPENKDAQLQESVYAKLVVNDGIASAAVERLRKNRPTAGLVQVMRVSEAAYATMEFITGDRKAYDEVDTTEELLIL